ncbi:MAG: hypothetical protein GEU90_22915, partial [Gemmatimonas sp.]|nr:hypothetical protein [Gemmatimonas sp.]
MMPLTIRDVARNADAMAQPLRNVAAEAFRELGQWRASRVFHPDGVLVHGDLVADPDIPLPLATTAVTARLSKAAGTPSAVPDVLGLAIRARTLDGRPWDILLATMLPRLLPRVLGRMIVAPARHWTQADYSSLLPYRHTGEAHAMLGDDAACEQALSHAESLLDRVTTTDPAASFVSSVQLGRLAGSC